MDNNARGISLKLTNIILTVVVLIISALLIAATYAAGSRYLHLVSPMLFLFDAFISGLRSSVDRRLSYRA